MKTQLGHYEIVSELGRGGMGVVYKGFEPALNRHVAIKELSPALAHDESLVERFLREARSMAALNDPNIIQIYFIGQENGQPFFVMEFVEGDSLSAILKREGRIDPADALKIIHQTAKGLATAHDRGVIHRDIKPGNLMITSRGTVKIADFGIALATQDLSKKLTSTGEFVGTPGYLSPEVCMGKAVDQRSDIFSLGIVLFEMLSGRMPFTDESPLGLMLEVVKAEVPDIRSLNSSVDTQTYEILSRMVAKEPGDRFRAATTWSRRWKPIRWWPRAARSSSNRRCRRPTPPWWARPRRPRRRAVRRRRRRWCPPLAWEPPPRPRRRRPHPQRTPPPARGRRCWNAPAASPAAGSFRSPSPPRCWCCWAARRSRSAAIWATSPPATATAS